MAINLSITVDAAPALIKSSRKEAARLRLSEDKDEQDKRDALLSFASVLETKYRIAVRTAARNTK